MNENLMDERNPSYAGIVAGIAKGDLWINTPENPTLVTAYSYCVGGCGVAGAIKREEEARDYFEQIVFPALKKKGIYEFEFSTEDDRLRQQLLSIFADQDIHWEQEYSYRRKKAIEKEFNVPTGYRIKEVDDSFLEKLYHREIQNADLLTERIKESWADRDTFLKNSIAYAAIYENSIAGVIFGSSQYKKYITIDIETEESHRRKGIGTALTKAFMDGCVRKGYVAQ
ncbi:MAG: GNAT family N-acetyltransferase [Lachnospiraceae bacterium]|nr:GNAT family N-acetyltransferase [Lachnospiraceae bacterium]